MTTATKILNIATGCTAETLLVNSAVHALETNTKQTSMHVDII